jgi:hypothetical protein
MSETWVTLDCGWLHDKRAEPQMRSTTESKWEDEAKRYCQNANYWREEGKKAIAREAKLREELDGVRVDVRRILDGRIVDLHRVLKDIETVLREEDQNKTKS